MASEQEAGSAVGVDDPQQQQAIAEEETTLATTLEGGGSWYWTNMLNFSQSGSSSSYTSAGQMAGSQITTGSPPSFSSVHNNNNAMNSGNNRNSSNNQVIHAATPLDSVLPCSNNNASNSDPENAVWGQDFLSGPICDSKASMPECSADDGLQELLYPRSVRELLLDVQSPSWDLLQQAAINKSFGFPLATDDQLAPAQLHGLLANADVKPTHVMQSGLHFSHDDRQSCSTASTTEPQWPVTQAAGTDHAAQADARACAMHVPRATFLQHQFDHTRVKQEYAQQLSSNCCASSSSAFPKASGINPFLLQHQQQQQHRLRLMSPTHDPAGLHLNEAAMANMNSDVKPSKQELHSWPSSPAAIATSMHLCRSSSSTFDLAGGQVHSPAGAAPAVDPHHFLLNSFQSQGHQHVENPGFPASHDAPFFQALDHHQLLQQAGLQGHLHRHPPGSVVNNQPIQYLNQQGGGLKKSRAHLEEPGKDMKGVAGSPDDFGLKRPKLESQQQQPASGSFKSQPARKEKLGDRITTLQQLVSPYGKTDTASVLLEAIGCIKFLQDQVQTLSSPYLKSTSNPTSQNGDNNQNGEESKPDLRSKGLCLVPISCTMQVANDNGTDYWYGGAFR